VVKRIASSRPRAMALVADVDDDADEVDDEFDDEADDEDDDADADDDDAGSFKSIAPNSAPNEWLLRSSLLHALPRNAPP
jgi:hypothetical protein